MVLFHYEIIAIQRKNCEILALNLSTNNYGYALDKYYALNHLISIEAKNKPKVC